MRNTARNCIIGMIAVCTLVLAATSIPHAQSLTQEAEVDLSKARRWTVLRNGGWVNVNGGKIDFMSPTKERLRRLDLRGNEFLFAPPVSDVVGVIAFADRQPKTLSSVTFDLFDESGTQIVRLNKPLFASVIIAPTGSAFVGVDGAKGLPESTLRFYDASGKSHDAVTISRYKGGEFTIDGSHVFIESSDSGLAAFAPSGEVVHQFGVVNHWAASHNGSVVMLQRGKRLFFYNNGALDQTLAWQPGNSPVRDMAVAPNGRHAVVATADRAFVIHVPSATVIWEAEPGSPEWSFRSVDLSDDLQLVAIGMDYDAGALSQDRHTQSRCLLFNSTGQLLDTKTDKPTDWGAQYPLVQFDRDHARLFFINRDRFRIFRITDLN